MAHMGKVKKLLKKQHGFKGSNWLYGNTYSIKKEVVKGKISIDFMAKNPTAKRMDNPTLGFWFGKVGFATKRELTDILRTSIAGKAGCGEIVSNPTELYFLIEDALTEADILEIIAKMEEAALKVKVTKETAQDRREKRAHTWSVWKPILIGLMPAVLIFFAVVLLVGTCAQCGHYKHINKYDDLKAQLIVELDAIAFAQNSMAYLKGPPAPEKQNDTWIMNNWAKLEQWADEQETKPVPGDEKKYKKQIKKAERNISFLKLQAYRKTHPKMGYILTRPIIRDIVRITYNFFAGVVVLMAGIGGVIFLLSAAPTAIAGDTRKVDYKYTDSDGNERTVYKE